MTPDNCYVRSDSTRFPKIGCRKCAAAACKRYYARTRGVA